MSRYASCSKVVAPSVIPTPRLASSRCARRCNSSYKAAKSASVAVRSPCSADATRADSVLSMTRSLLGFDRVLREGEKGQAPQLGRVNVPSPGDGMLRCPMYWRIKGVIQKTLGYLPFGDRLHYELQKRAGGLRMFDDELA